MSADLPGKRFYHTATISDAINWNKSSKDYLNPYEPVSPDGDDEWELVSACAFGDKVVWYWKCEQ